MVDDPFLADGTHVGPLAKWAEIAGVYADGGIPALRVAVGQEENHTYIVALLEEVHSQEAAQALFQLFAAALDAPSWDDEVAPRLVNSLNSFFSHFSSRKRKPIAPTEEQGATVRAFLMKLFAETKTMDQRASIICALRGVGDDSTLNFLVTLEAFPFPWEGIEKQALRAVRKRLRMTP